MNKMATSTYQRFLVVGIFLAIKCTLAFAHAQLQQGDTDSRSHAALIVYEMMGDFYELKYENKQMAEKIAKLEENQKSVETATENTIGSLEKKVETLEEALNLQKTSAVDQLEKIKKLEGKLKSQETSSASQTEKIEKLEDKIESMEDDSAVGHSGAIKTLEEKLESLENYTKGMRSAFTVINPVEGSETKTARFTRVVTNVGGHYSTSSGTFTCAYPGIYVFTLHILQQSSVDYAGCLIRKNSSAVSREAYTGTLTSNKVYYSSSTSVILQLVRGDIVDVYCRSGLGSILSSHSSFSGFLNKAD